jgi:uncharacterized protein (TIGR03435 family)
MTVPASWASLGNSPLVRHLWQSTVFAAAVWLLSLALRRNAARTRFRLWTIASAKFLIPFSLLIAAGRRLQGDLGNRASQPAFSTVVESLGQPLLAVRPGAPSAEVTASPLTAAPQAAHHPVSFLWLLAALWAAGAAFLLARWTRSWRYMRAALRGSFPVELPFPVPVRLISTTIEPGVFGIFRPVLLLPRGLMDHLNPSQLDAVLAHELCHIRRRDNLFAALHIVVEVLFWFHPAVWWIQTKLLEERERACDESVLTSRGEALAYAESILNVCRFCVGAPLDCVSGVTGSDLKKRIVRIMSQHRGRPLSAGLRLLLAAAAVIAVGLPLSFGIVRPVHAQTKPVSNRSIEGTWQGTVHTPDGRDLRIVLQIAKGDNGALKGTLYSIDQNGSPVAANSVSFEERTLRLESQLWGLTYEGRMSPDGNSISGTVQSNGSYPLVLERATPETAWTIPAPPPHIAPMAADANPGIEVAAIRPSPPNAPRTVLTFRGSMIVIQRMSLNDLIEYAWNVQEKQIIDGPGWMTTDKWDIEAKPDTPGMPSSDQLRQMVEKLVGERFALRSHEEKREMAAYVLALGKDGPKMTKSADQSGGPRYSVGPGGLIRMLNANMGDFAALLQRTTLDRPVLDQSGLRGRWDFVLRWRWDESQFGGQVPPPTADDPAASLPPLFTALQEQLGLKLESQKADVPVLVIDHVAHPSPN